MTRRIYEKPVLVKRDALPLVAANGGSANGADSDRRLKTDIMQVGMLRALAEAGIVPDLVLGTSIGALNGAFVAADPSLEGILRLGEPTRLDDDACRGHLGLRHGIPLA